MVAVNDFAVVKTVSAEQLERATYEGWRVIQTIEVEDARTVYEHDMAIAVPAADPNRYGGDPSRRPKVERTVVVKTMMFLVGKDESSAVGLLTSQLRQAHRELADAQGNERLAKSHLGVAEKALNEAKKDIEERTEFVIQLRKQNEQREERLRKMEQDMAKIRHAVGDLKVKEILGDQK